MKTQLTIEQSNKLLQLGVPTEKASIPLEYIEVALPNTFIFTLTDLLDTLPKEIINEENQRNNFYLNFGYIRNEWVVTYENIDVAIVNIGAKELIDSLYELLIWTIAEGYLKF